MTAMRQWNTEAHTDRAGEAGGSPVLDLDHLRGYTMDSPGLERELLGIFQTQMREHLTVLRQARSCEDWKFSAHTLKGAARAMGAGRVADAAAGLDNAGFEASADEKARLLSRLEDEIVVCERVICDLMA